MAGAASDWKALKCRPPDRFEDGTTHFLGVAALQFGLDFFEDLGGMDAVKRHVESLRRRAVARLSRLRHSNGAPLVELLGRHGYAGPEAVEDVQGGIVNFRVLGSAGQLWNYRHVHDAASEAGLHIRSGCACNPGACFCARMPARPPARVCRLSWRDAVEHWRKLSSNAFLPSLSSLSLCPTSNLPSPTSPLPKPT